MQQTPIRSSICLVYIDTNKKVQISDDVSLQCNIILVACFYMFICCVLLLLFGKIVVQNILSCTDINFIYMFVYTEKKKWSKILDHGSQKGIILDTIFFLVFEYIYNYFPLVINAHISHVYIYLTVVALSILSLFCFYFYYLLVTSIAISLIESCTSFIVA